MKTISFRNVDITDGFWKTKQDMVKNTTVHAVYNRFCDTHRFSALDCSWREVDGEESKPHIFYDSDVAKWLEGACYILSKEKNDVLQKIVDDSVEKIIKNADENGYFNSHFLTVRPSARFTNRFEHELYCLGHLIEASIAYRHATGKDNFLRAMCKYADYVDRIFVQEKSALFTTPGHPELELALVKLYEETGLKKYLDLAVFFVENHGHRKESLDPSKPYFMGKYNMDEMPLRERKTIDGHCVRAVYLMTGVADVAKHTKDSSLAELCKRLFDNCTQRRMYITGGIGSTYMGEAFTADFHLPSRRAYTETCAAIGLVYFASRMMMLDTNSKYADIIEKVMYNGLLSGVSLDGKSFFYENPIEVDPEFNDVATATSQRDRYPSPNRSEVFGCSCCPPNMVRFIPSVGDYIYSTDENTVYVNQYIDSTSSFDGVEILQKTAYPSDGKVSITAKLDGKRLALRIPAWCKSFTVNKAYTMENGYAVIHNTDGDILIDFDMPVTLIRANRRVHNTAGRVAVTRGPVVYCLEEADNGKDLRSVRIDRNREFAISDSEFLLPSIITKGLKEKESDILYSDAAFEYDEVDLKFIPYYAFANRGVCEMLIWVLS